MAKIALTGFMMKVLIKALDLDLGLDTYPLRVMNFRHQWQWSLHCALIRAIAIDEALLCLLTRHM